MRWRNEGDLKKIPEALGGRTDNLRCLQILQFIPGIDSFLRRVSGFFYKKPILYALNEL